MSDFKTWHIYNVTLAVLIDITPYNVVYDQIVHHLLKFFLSSGWYASKSGESIGMFEVSS